MNATAFSVLREGALDDPYLFAGLGVEGDEETIERVEENLAVGVVDAAVDDVAAGARRRRKIAIRPLVVGPDLDRVVRIGQVERLHDVRPGADEEHHRLAVDLDDDRLALVAVQRPVDCAQASCRRPTFSLLMSLRSL